MTTLEVEASVSSKVQITLPAALRAHLGAAEVAQRHRLAITDAVVYSIARDFDATFWTQNVNDQGLPGVRFEAKPTRL